MDNSIYVGAQWPLTLAFALTAACLVATLLLLVAATRRLRGLAGIRTESLAFASRLDALLRARDLAGLTALAQSAAGQPTGRILQAGLAAGARSFASEASPLPTGLERTLLMQLVIRELERHKGLELLLLREWVGWLVHASPLAGLLGTILGILTAWWSLQNPGTLAPLQWISQHQQQVLGWVGALLSLILMTTIVGLRNLLDRLEVEWSALISRIISGLLEPRP